MKAYHGSDSDFKKLKISKNLVKRGSTKTNEGYGIYFSTDIEVAKSYGQYVYMLEINDEYLLNFKSIKVCRRYLYNIRLEIKKKYNLDIADYIKLEEVAEYMKLGGLSICGTGRELYRMLDSNYKWYQDVSNTKIENVYRLLRNYDKKHLKAYTFNYHIPNIGVIKDVSEDVVRIVKKEQRHLI